MIIKPLEKPISLLQEEALHRRLVPHHSKRQEVISRYRQSLAGFLGEKEVYYYLSLLPQSKYRIFHNLRLRDETYSFQIDFLVLTNRFILILEVKKFQGKVIFNEFDQLIQVKENGQEELHPNPVSQVIRQKWQLERWLEKFRFPSSPIVPYVVFTSSTRIENTVVNATLQKHVLSSPNILLELEELNSRFQKIVLNENQLNRLSQMLLANNNPLRRNILEHYQLSVSDIRKGVLCPHCQHSVMKYKYLKWICPECEYKDCDIYIQALNDYFLLIDDSITLKENLKFLQISSNKVARNLLMKAGYMYTGTTKNRKYLLELKRMY